MKYKYLVIEGNIGAGKTSLASKLAGETGSRLVLEEFSGPNNNANKGRRNSLANRATSAANLIAQGDYQGAIDKLVSLLEKVDGLSSPPDWMDGPQKDAVADDVGLLIALLELLS